MVFHVYVQTLKFIPGHVLFLEGEVLGVLGFGLIAIAWLLVPFWEIKAKPNWRIRPMNVIGIVAIVYMVILTVLGYIV